MALDFGAFDRLDKLTDKQRQLHEILVSANFKNAFEDDAPTWEGALRQALSILNLKTEPDLADDQRSPYAQNLLKILSDPENLKATLEAFDYAENVENPKQKKVENFYEGPRFQELYQLAQEKKGPGVKVEASDIGELLKNGTPEDKEIFDLLEGDCKDLSKSLWAKSEFKKRLEEASKITENKDIAEFFKDLSDIPPEDQHDAKKLILAFQKKFPNYQNKENEPWYLNKFEEQLNLLKNPELKTLQDFYESDDFKKVCNQLSQTLGQAPVWKDIERALKAAGFEHIIALARKHEAASIAMTEKIWAREEKKFNELEKAEFDAFADKLTAKDFADLEATAERFQKTRKRYAGAPRLKWYREQLESKRPILEMQWQTQVDDFFSQPIRGLYVKASQQVDGYPKWTDISALITDENLKYLLEEKYRTKAETLWATFWKERERTFNEKGEQQLAAFFNHIKPNQLDDLAKAQADFKALHPEQKADTPWFKTAFEQACEKTKVDLESRHQDLVAALSDRTLASAMQSAFKNAHTFAEREKWLSENEKKVAEYQSFIEQNNQLETEITTRSSEHPDLKKELSQIKGAYQEGRKSYTEGFYSPRKYNEKLRALNEKVSERERLVSHTMNFIENKNFNQIPKLTDKKKLSYDEFRDELKKLNFYELDPAVRKNEKVRTAARAKTTALHQQWLDHRALYLEKNKQTQIEKSQAVIKRVKLPKNMPENLADYTAFTVALKEKGVYAALPKGVLKNEKVRATAHEQNMKMWQQYQTAKTKKSVATEKSTPLTTPEFKTAESEIKAVKLTPTLQQKLSDKLKDKNATNPDIFTVALREIGIYAGVNKNLWQNPNLREVAWKQNLKLQQAFLEKQKVESPTTKNEHNETENNFGLPGHYKINWEKLEAPRTAPDKKAKAVERFKQMHNRSETGLQAVMQQFHQPLGTFVLQTLATMPQDRFDKALNALKNIRVQAGNRADTSQWLKVLCENAGLDFLAKETSVDWSQFKQGYSTYFGTSLDKAWATETPHTEPLEEMFVDDPAKPVKPLIDTGEAEDIQVVDTQPASDEETMLESNTATSVLNVDPTALVPGHLNLSDSTLDETESEVLAEEDLFADTVVESELAATEATLEDADDAWLENEDEKAEIITEIDDQALALEPTIVTSDTLEAADPEVDESAVDTAEVMDENFEDKLETTDTKKQTTEVGSIETEIATDLEEVETPSEIIVPAPIEAQEKEAMVEKALLEWKNFTETNLPPTASQEAVDLKKQFSEILKTGLDEATIAQLKASGTWEKLMASPAHQQLLRTHLKQHQALNRTERHFFTALQQELFFSRSVTVAKFLERLKSYIQFTKEINATILTPNVQAEFDAETAQSLFKAFATKYHQTSQLENLTLSYQNEQLLVVAKTKLTTQHWHFKAPAVRLS